MPSKAKPEEPVKAPENPFAPVGEPAIETLLTAEERVARHEKEAK